MADKRISQLVDRGTVVNSDVVPIVVSGAVTTNKATISSIQTFMQGNLDLGVTSVGITTGSTGTDINVTGSPVTSSGNITINIPTASAANRGLLNGADWNTFNSKLDSVGLIMPSAFTVTNSPLTSNGSISVAGAGTVSQYIRGDGSLADFPQGGGGGGASVSYYLNGSVSQGTIGGIAYLEMNKTPILGAGTDFTIAADGYIASFITDAGDPALLQIPAGNWNFETYFQASSGGGSPTFYVELYKVNSGGTATLIASSSANPELIAFGTSTTPYFSALAVPTTTLTITDRLAIRYYVVHSGRTITLHTENGNLCQIITTFTTGLTALNGLTAQVQNFAVGTSGTDFNISSASTTHTFNIPSASATNRGLVTTVSQTFAGAKTFNSDIIVNGITVGKGGASNGNNTAIGLNSLSSNTTGTLNTATGLSALQFNTGGNSNTANGANSLVANTTGGFNTAIGGQSLYSNTTGQANTAVGLNSLYANSTGTYNIGIGSGAGYYIADGSTPNTTSDFSIYLGADTKASVDNAQNETVIGYNAIGSGSNTVTIGNSSVTDNYFTGTVRSTSLRLAAAGTADPTFFRNTSGTSSSTGSANVLGFNGSNNIFVTTNSRGGFVLDFNNSVSNRTYTLQDASGTLAFTSQIPTVAGVYLPLAGGTLTGALNGTSATFSNSTNGEQSLANNNPNSGSSAISVFNLQNNVSVGQLVYTSSTYTGGYDGIGANTYALINRSGTGAFKIITGGFTDAQTRLTIASTGAATFSSTLSVGGSSTLLDQVFLGSAGVNGNITWDGSNTYFNSGTSKNLSFGTNNTINNRLVILNGGNVGIGTASPSYGLDLFSENSARFKGSGSSMTLNLDNSSSSGGGGVYFRQNGTIGGGIGSSGWWLGDTSNDLLLVSTSGRNIRFLTNDVSPAKMTIASTGNVGIGTNTPSAKLEIQNSPANDWGISVWGNTTTGQSYGGIIRGGTNSSDIAFRVNNAANSSTYFSVRGDGAIFTGSSTTSPYNNTTAAAANLHVSDNGLLFRSTSSIKYKKNVQDYTKGLDDVMKLRPVTYEGISEIDSDKIFAGLIAEEVHELGLTEFVQYAEDGTPDALAYSNMVSLLIKAIQELKTEIDSLKNQIK
jgi:hypothetical protein